MRTTNLWDTKQKSDVTIYYSGLDFTPAAPTRVEDQDAPVIVVLHGLTGGERVFLFIAGCAANQHLPLSRKPRVVRQIGTCHCMQIKRERRIGRESCGSQL